MALRVPLFAINSLQTSIFISVLEQQNTHSSRDAESRFNRVKWKIINLAIENYFNFTLIHFKYDFAFLMKQID